MKNLVALIEVPTYLDRYVAIRDKKQSITKAPLVAAHSLVKERYVAHAQAIEEGNLAALESDPRALKIERILRACYNGGTQPLRQLKKAIRDAQPKRLLKYCPMCGTTLPGTFDHYMPAVKFPEFAVHPLNLVPCCAKCNSTKDDDWLSAAMKRQFLHVYKDKIPDLQFVKVALHENKVLNAVGATFSLEKPVGMDEESWGLIESHFRRLKLIDRYDELGNDEIGEILSDTRVFRDAGGTDVQDFLSGRAADRREVYGRNHWIAVLMQALAQHPNLTAWIRPS